MILQLQYLVALCSHNLGLSSRRILGKLGSNPLWSEYSLKGRKLKRSFADLPICTLIISKFLFCELFTVMSKLCISIVYFIYGSMQCRQGLWIYHVIISFSLCLTPKYCTLSNARRFYLSMWKVTWLRDISNEIFSQSCLIT